MQETYFIATSRNLISQRLFLLFACSALIALAGWGAGTVRLSSNKAVGHFYFSNIKC